jgi:hypothetical protein
MLALAAYINCCMFRSWDCSTQANPRRRIREALHQRHAAVTSLDLAFESVGASLKSLTMNAAITGIDIDICYLLR